MNYVLLYKGDAIYAQFCDVDKANEENRKIEKDGLLWISAEDYIEGKAKH